MSVAPTDAGAHSTLAERYAGFTEGWDEPDLRDARALLGPLDVSVPRRAPT